MQKKYPLVRQIVEICDEFEPYRFREEDHFTTRQNYATETLIALAEGDHSDQPWKKKEQHFGAQITSWNNNFMNLVKNDGEKVRRKRNFHVRMERQSMKEQPCIDNGVPPSIGISIKKQVNKLRVPLKEKTLNQQQFSSWVPQRNKTRNEIKLQILSCKHELSPLLRNRKKVKTEWRCHNIIKQNDDNKQYRRIKRKDFYTIHNEEDRGSDEPNMQMIRSKSKNITNRTDNSRLVKLRGNSIKQLFVQ